MNFKGPKGSTLVSKVVGKMKNNKPYCYSPSPPTTPRTGTPDCFSTPRNTNSNSFIGSPSTPSGSSTEVKKSNFTHMGLEFLQEGFVKDARRNPPSHPDYDPKTLYVPQTFLDKCTPVSIL